ncbi:hypothetical protein BDD12DRAFT_909105 [Trichophaea hybrida]|nr:hypothetical protein BDD12DRAFT_909105 [Trichophaea hybrida]
MGSISTLSRLQRSSFAKDQKDDQENRLVLNFRNGQDRPWSPGNSLSRAERGDIIHEVVNKVEKLSLHPRTSTRNSRSASDSLTIDDDRLPGACHAAQSGGNSSSGWSLGRNSAGGGNFHDGSRGGGGNTRLPSGGNRGDPFGTRKEDGEEGEEGDDGCDSGGVDDNRAGSTEPRFNCPAIKRNTKKEDLPKECQKTFRTKEKAKEHGNRCHLPCPICRWDPSPEHQTSECSYFMKFSNLRRHIQDIHLKTYQAQRTPSAFEQLRRKATAATTIEDLEVCLLFKPDGQGRRRKRYDAMDKTDCLTEDEGNDTPTAAAPLHEANGRTIGRQFNTEYCAANDSGRSRLILDFIYELGEDSRKHIHDVINSLDRNPTSPGKRDAGSLSNSEDNILKPAQKRMNHGIGNDPSSNAGTTTQGPCSPSIAEVLSPKVRDTPASDGVCPVAQLGGLQANERIWGDISQIPPGVVQDEGRNMGLTAGYPTPMPFLPHGGQSPLLPAVVSSRLYGASTGPMHQATASSVDEACPVAIIGSPWRLMTAPAAGNDPFRRDAHAGHPLDVGFHIGGTFETPSGAVTTTSFPQQYHDQDLSQPNLVHEPSDFNDVIGRSHHGFFLQSVEDPLDELLGTRRQLGSPSCQREMHRRS